MIDFVSLKRVYDIYAAEYEEAGLRTMRSGWYVLGNELKSFEEEFAGYLGAEYCVGLNSGLDALTLAVRALGIGAGDEVIVPSNTYIASVLGITANGATPVFVEPDGDFCIDVDRIEEAITDRTRAILPVHLYGNSCNMERICSIAKEHGLYVIEDCAQSHGAMWDGKMTGTFGDIGCFSFYPTKPLGALGDSGAIVTDKPELAEAVRKLRNYGSGIKYYNEVDGVNSRMDELQAALLKVGLKHLDENNEYRSKIAKLYLDGIDNELVRLREVKGSVYHVFPVLCNQRDRLQRHLEERGIKTLIHYPVPPYMQECYRGLGYEIGSFPIADMLAAEELSLPIYAGMPENEVKAVIDAVNSFEV